MTEEVAGRAVYGCVAEVFEREALTWIFDSASDRAPDMDERNLHILAGIEMPAMLHGVHKNFLKGSNNGFPVSFRNTGVFGCAKELDQAICGGDVAAGCQANPSGRRRK